MPPAGNERAGASGARGGIRVFVHSPSEAPDARTVTTRMPEFECLGERALLLARPGDVVCVAQPVDPAYLEFLGSLSIGPRAEDVLTVPGVVPGAGLSERLLADPSALDRLAGRLAGSGPVALSPFFTTPAAEGLARALGTRLGRPVRALAGPSGLVRRLHDKRFARRLARRLGIPIAPGEAVRVGRGGAAGADLSALRAAVLRRSRETGRAIVRGSSGASGSSTFVTDASGIEATLDAIAARTDNAVYVVEPFFAAAVSPNVAFTVDPESGDVRAAATDQVLDDALVYRGSVHPSRARRLPEMLADARALAGWMRDRGFTGYGGVDFVERAGDPAGPGYFLTEINPRINGASYPLALLARLRRRTTARGGPPPRAFRTGGLALDARDFEPVGRLAGSLLFDLARGEGVVPLAVAGLAFGKLGLASFAATRERAEEIFGEVVRRARATGKPVEPRTVSA